MKEYNRLGQRVQTKPQTKPYSRAKKFCIVLACIALLLLTVFLIMSTINYYSSSGSSAIEIPETSLTLDGDMSEPELAMDDF